MSEDNKNTEEENPIEEGAEEIADEIDDAS